MSVLLKTTQQNRPLMTNDQMRNAIRLRVAEAHAEGFLFGAALASLVTWFF